MAHASFNLWVVAVAACLYQTPEEHFSDRAVRRDGGFDLQLHSFRWRDEQWLERLGKRVGHATWNVYDSGHCFLHWNLSCSYRNNDRGLMRPARLQQDQTGTGNGLYSIFGRNLRAILKSVC